MFISLTAQNKSNVRIITPASLHRYKPTEKENDDYEPESDLTPKEEPIYVNVQVV